MSNAATPPPAPSFSYPPPAPPAAKTGNGLATAGFVLGLLGFLGSFIPLLNVVGIVLGLLGAILAAVGLVKAKKSGVGKGLAVTGLVLGVLAVVIAIVMNAVFVKAVDDALGDATGVSVETPADGADGDASVDGDEDESSTAEATEEASADSEVGTTRANPVPLGSAITGGDWTVTVNSVSTLDQDTYGQTAESGKTLLVVNLTATYNGDDEQGATPWAVVKYVTPDGTTISTTDGSTLFIAENAFDSLTTVYNGASVTGDQILEVPADEWESGVLAIAPGLFTNDTFVSVT